MQSVIDTIVDWLKRFLVDIIIGNIGSMFDDLNTRVGEIAGEVGKTPQAWNGSIFGIVRNLSETVIIPIAGIVIAYVLCYELVSAIIERNHMHDIDTFLFFKWVFKAFLAVLIVSHTFDLTMAIFEVGQHVVQASAGVITGGGALDLAPLLAGLEDRLMQESPASLFGLCLETLLIGQAVKILSVCIFFVIYGRMMEIYAVCSIGPIPLATLANREWGHMGQNYLRTLAALAFQGFFIMLCVGIYAVLVQTIATSSDVRGAIWSCAGYTALLCFALFKTGAVAKSVFGAH